MNTSIDVPRLKAIRVMEHTDTKKTELFFEFLGDRIIIDSHEWNARGFHLWMECYKDDLTDFRTDNPGTPEEDVLRDFAFKHMDEWNHQTN